MVCFDLFHTLVDPEEFRPRAFRRTEEAARVLGLRTEAFQRAWGDAIDERNRHAKPTVRERLRTYCEGQGVAAPPGAFDLADDLMGRYQDQAILAPRPEVLSTLQTLSHRGYRMALVSNCDEREGRAWPRSPLVKWVPVASLSFQTGAVKPEPEAYLQALRALGGAEPRHAIFVGDGWGGELEGARDLGYGQVIWQKGFVSRNGLRTPHELTMLGRAATREIDGIPELLRLLPDLT